jgi:hypothetical protein
MSIRPLVGGTPVIVRHFKSHWLATLYFPMSKLESAARHTEVMLAVVDESFSPGGAATYQEITVSGSASSPPSPYFQPDDVQYFPPGPEFPLSNEAAAQKAHKAEEEARLR